MQNSTKYSKGYFEARKAELDVAYNALKAGGITFNWPAYLASFISPNLALRIGELERI